MSELTKEKMQQRSNELQKIPINELLMKHVAYEETINQAIEMIDCMERSGHPLFKGTTKSFRDGYERVRNL